MFLLAIPLAAFAGVLKMLDGVTTSIENVYGLIALVAVMTALIEPLMKVGDMMVKDPQSILGFGVGLAALTLMAAPLLAFVSVLNTMGDITNCIEKVVALSILSGVMTVLVIALSALGTSLMGPQILGLVIGIAALWAMSIPLKKFIEILRSMEDISNATENVKAIVILISSLTACMTALGILSPLIAMGIYTLYALVDFVTAVGIFATAVWAIMDAKPELKDFLENGTYMSGYFKEYESLVSDIYNNEVQIQKLQE